MALDFYASVAEKRTVDYEYESRALDIVKQFVAERKLIVFGGLAIDMALRLKQSKIYRDDEKPDIDVLSNDSVRDAYDLCELLRSKQFIEVHAVRAIHIQTMRVRTNGIFVIDIGYVPDSIKIPFLHFGNLKIVHPDFQRMDIHLSLSFPYSGCPRENIFNRWSKDIKRFNMFEEHYPIKKVPLDASNHTVKFKVDKHETLHGFAAYACYYKALLEIKTFAKSDVKIDISPLDISYKSGHIELNAPEEFATVTSHLLEDTQYKSYLDLLPEHSIIDNKYIYSTKNKLLAATLLEVDDHEFAVASIQYVAVYMLANYTKTNKSFYLHYYKCILEMIQLSYEMIKDLDSPFSLLTTTVGTVNEDDSYLIRVAKNAKNYSSVTKKEIDHPYLKLLQILPKEYFKTERPPPYDYNNKYFMRDGSSL